VYVLPLACSEWANEPNVRLVPMKGWHGQNIATSSDGAAAQRAFAGSTLLSGRGFAGANEANNGVIDQMYRAEGY